MVETSEIVQELRPKMSLTMFNSQAQLKVLKTQNQELEKHRGRNRGKRKTKNGYAASCIPVSTLSVYKFSFL